MHHTISIPRQDLIFLGTIVAGSLIAQERVEVFRAVTGESLGTIHQSQFDSGLILIDRDGTEPTQREELRAYIHAVTLLHMGEYLAMVAKKGAKPRRSRAKPRAPGETQRNVS